MGQRTRRVGVEPCSIEGCTALIKARNWCVKHWTRWQRYGSPIYRVPGEVIDGKKVCTACRTDKPLADYHRAGRSSYCKPCEADRQRAYLKANPRKPRALNARDCICEVCGRKFTGDNRNYLRCSPECRKAGVNRANLKFVQKRRAMERHPGAESIAPREVLERDEWTCGLCGDPIDRAFRAPHPGTPSIDHILPLSRGGTHTWDNVQAAHLGCNVKKGNRLTG